MYTLNIILENKRFLVPAENGDLISTHLQANIPDFALPCAGHHTCGKCIVSISGSVSEPSDHERELLGEKAIAKGYRLACATKITGDATVTLHHGGTSKIISWYQLPEYEKTEIGYGISVDIGTTTVAVQLIERSSGQILSEELAENAQRGFGADVISRIEACKTAGLDTLSNRITEQIESMILRCMEKANVTSIEESVVTGNSTMLHLFEGLDPSSLAVVPFDVQSHFGCYSKKTLADAPVYMPRCIGAYIGADIVCAILASDMFSKGTQLLVDIGTNGEMALCQNQNIICCATAAGPAFEGAGLSSGMPAAPGAIRAVHMDQDEISYETVADEKAIGVCGSGILDALSIMLEKEIIDDTGYLENPEIDEDEEDPDYWEIGDSEIYITQKDVRQIQLAKSAICAGLLTLLDHKEISAENVDRFVIAGGFGNSMNHSSASTIGLFPATLEEKSDFIGNAALGGATMLLCNKALRTFTENMSKDATELELSTSPKFMEYYVDCMAFEEF